MGQEIERKFLLPAAPDWIGEHPSQQIEQGYLAVTDNAEVRIRRRGEDTTWAVKRGAGESRDEVELPVTPEAFDELWPLTEGRRVRKRRHVVALPGELSAEVDVYQGDLEGLVTAEVEFESTDAAREFDAPAWMGHEVTGDERYANQRLALGGPPA